MIFVGLDDTDTLDDPGTNQLARHIVRALSPEFDGELILRHQLLQDPRVPCTNKNGCASIRFRPRAQASTGELIERVRKLMLDWCPAGSDPGLCVAQSVSEEVVRWGRRCQGELVSQQEAHRVAEGSNAHLEGLGGSRDGVIGALAAIGLMATANDGRVIHLGSSEEDLFEITGIHPIEVIYSRGVSQIVCPQSGEVVRSGSIDVGKRLRPNYRDGKVVLFAAPAGPDLWQAMRVA
ncbi:MAG TPA: hypothetical protein VG826_28490 [Pirellulales bacterium]|nr:hypothetical protein [Pirellulales bacterium]